jgi:HAD superfamily hydrolase (TIGR01509 family)
MNPTQPKAVIFDLGKVLLDFDYAIVARRMASRCSIGEVELLGLLNQSPLLYRYETGLMTSAEFFTEVQHASGFTESCDEFGALFGEIFTPIEEMVSLHASLRTKGVPTYIFSNTNEFAIRAIRRLFPFFSGFDGYVLSHEHGAMKPSARLYEVVESMTGLRGPDLLYIDDRPENVEAGLQRGWSSILHESPAQTRCALEKYQMV